jgi:hypothetical protein
MAHMFDAADHVSMKLRVQRADGKIETISLREGTWSVIDGRFQNRITTEPRLDHYFTPDGHYDGWGGAVCCDEQTAADLISAMERKRKISPSYCCGLSAMTMPSRSADDGEVK